MAVTDMKVTVEPGASQVIAERYLPASPDKVFRAMTDPGLIEQWWGPRRYKTRVDEYEPRRGGCWRFSNVDDDGNEFGFNGVIHELLRDERITQTFEFEGAPGHVVLEQLRLVPEGDGTRVHVVSAFTSVEDRDAMAQTGMTEGMAETYDRLEELLERI